MAIADDSLTNWDLYHRFITTLNVDPPFLWVVVFSNTAIDLINYRRTTKLFKATIENLIENFINREIRAPASPGCYDVPEFNLPRYCEILDESNAVRLAFCYHEVYLRHTGTPGCLGVSQILNPWPDRHPAAHPGEGEKFNL